MKLQGIACLLALTGLVSLTHTASAQTTVDPNLLPYRVPNEQLRGKITLIGSNTMAQVAAVWGDNFRRLNPGVEIDIQIKGAVNAVPSVMSGEATFGMMSRPITQEEVIAFNEKFGYAPTVLTPSLEPIAIYVHKDNPVQSLTLAQVDQIYSTSLRRGAKQTAMTWGDVGATGQWAQVAIKPLGRSDTTGSQVFIQQAVLGGGTFRDDLVNIENNLDLVKQVGADQRAIGFAGSMFEIPEARAVKIAWRDGDAAFDVHTAGYPLVRPLQLVVNHAPQKEMTPVEREFLKYVFSRQGQEAVHIAGFISVPARPAEVALQAVEIKTLN
ncbi:MAG: PstS family phosphate ABC transporter substrate-binding protein [Planctomycetaceae bacterium]|nr:PstS family phosphate ABC transporter substrate-binding protein [Planctomycetaceae bacterium]